MVVLVVMGVMMMVVVMMMIVVVMVRIKSTTSRKHSTYEPTNETSRVDFLYAAKVFSFFNHKNS
jgi:NADH:ubiquinone oxidoreductase subunit 3 (subunit A)